MRLSNAQGELQPSGHAVTANSLGQLQLDDFKSKQNASATSLIMITDNTNKYVHMKCTYSSYYHINLVSVPVCYFSNSPILLTTWPDASSWYSSLGIRHTSEVAAVGMADSL